LAQRFPLPLLDCDSSVKRKELLSDVISPGPESQSKRQSNKLVLAGLCIVILVVIFLSKQAYNDHDTLLISRTLAESKKP
jgi:hypothetical protein